jgi:hypothetical protein
VTRARVSRELLGRQPAMAAPVSPTKRNACNGSRAAAQSSRGRMNASKRSGDVVIWREDDTDAVPCPLSNEV